MDGYNLISLLGLVVLLVLAWAFSANRRKVQLRTVVMGVGIQLTFGILVFLIPAGAVVFMKLSDLVVKMLAAASEGIRFCFGPLAVPPGADGSLGFILVIQGLLTIVFFAALMEVLYFLKIMPFVLKAFSRFFTWLMRVSGAEALCSASSIFVGIESATTVRPYLEKMTRSEICTVLTTLLATIASSVMGLYVILLQGTFPNIAGHLISASLLSAPAALVMSKILLPEKEQPETLGMNVEPYYDKEPNLLVAIMRGATAGGKMVIGVTVMLLAFLGLLALVNMGLGWVGVQVSRLPGIEISLRLENLLGYVFVPFTLIIGVPPADCLEVAKLLGMRAIVTEIPAYQQLGELIANGTFQHGRSAVLASYALCGFAHIPAIAIFIGGIGALAPGQNRTMSQVALRALLAATLACLLTAAVAGIFYGHGSLLLETQ